MELNITNFFRDADFLILDDDEKREAFRAFVRESGGCDDAEISAWSYTELNALCIQWISGDMRESGLTGCPDDDWQAYEQASQAGQCAGRIFKADDGSVYFYIGS